jgi:hypothetical protein
LGTDVEKVYITHARVSFWGGGGVNSKQHPLKKETPG